MELYTADGVRVLKNPARVGDSTEAVLAPTDGALLVSLYRLCLRLHHAGDDTILHRGTAALQGTAAAGMMEDAAKLDPRTDSSQRYAWNLTAAGTSAALGPAAAHASYPFYLLPQSTSLAATTSSASAMSQPSVLGGGSGGWQRVTGQPEWGATAVSLGSTRDPTGSGDTQVYNTNGAAKGVDDIPLRLSLSTLRARGSGNHGDADDATNAPVLALPILQLQSTERVLECAPALVPHTRPSHRHAHAGHAQTQTRGADRGAAELTASPLLLCCTATRVVDGVNLSAS